jgi:hypothetical protein
MKIFCTILVAILLIHLQCGASCLVDSLKVQTAPPCHQHHSDESKSRCGGQGSLLEAKLVPLAVMTQPVLITTPVVEFAPEEVDQALADTFAPLRPLSSLRI